MSTLHRTHHQVLFFFQKSLRNLFWASFLRNSGFSLVDIFAFVYLYRLGSAHHFLNFLHLRPFQEGMLLVVVYVLILRISDLCTVFPLAWIAAKMGLPKAAIVGNFLMAARYALLALSIQIPSAVFIAAFIQGIEIAVFTPAYDTMFARLASKSKVGRDVGAFTFILRLTHSLLPALAGTLIVTFGFSAAFIGAMILLILSSIPLLSMQWKERLQYPKPSQFIRWYRKEGDSRVILAVVGRYVSDVASELWPIYLVLLFGKVERLGLLMSVSLFISLIVTYFSGWYVDHTKRNKLFLMGGALLSVFWIGRIGILAVQAIFALEIGQKIVESFFSPSFDAHVYRISKRLDTFAFHVYKEALITVIAFFYWSLIGILTLFYGQIWGFIFICGAIGILATSLLYTTRYD